MTTNTQWIQTRMLRSTKGGQDFDESKQMSLCDWFDTVMQVKTNNAKGRKSLKYDTETRAAPLTNDNSGVAFFFLLKNKTKHILCNSTEPMS